MKHIAFAWVVMATMATSLAQGHAAPPPLFPLDQVRRGQQGYGLTTFAGTTPEKFSFEVVGVMHNFLPKMDIVLVKSADPKLAVSGFWQGMSGSPLFIDNKLVCAFSYGFRFNKVALGGCTPIQYMIDEGFVAPRGNAPGAVVGPASAFASELDAIATSAPVMPFRAQAQAAPAVEGYFASVPLAVSGAGGKALAYLQDALSPFHLTPMRAGGASGGAGGPGDAGPKEFTMGGPIAVILIRGDMSAAATGTVSYIDGDRVLAFGHPMMQTGETYAPVATAEVHGVVPSAMSAFVLASPQREIGALLQDRQSMIMADTRYRSPMIPMQIDLKVPGERGAKVARTFKVELMQTPEMTGSLAFAAASSALELYAPDATNAVVRIESTLELKGLPALTFRDLAASDRGAAETLIAVRALRLISPLMRNPFMALNVTGIRVKLDIDYGYLDSDIYDLRVAGGMLRPGQRNWVEVLSRGRYDQQYVDKIAVDVPEELAGAQVVLQVLPGSRVAPNAPPPADQASLLTYVRAFVPGDALVATLTAPAEGVALDGVAVRDLPPWAADKLATTTSTREPQAFRGSYRTATPAPRAMSGDATLVLRVANPR